MDARLAMRSGTRLTLALVCTSLLACEPIAPPRDAGTIDAARPQGVLIHPQSSSPWAGMVPVVMLPTADLGAPALAQIDWLAIDGVEQPPPEQRLDGRPPTALVDTRTLADGPHHLSAIVLAETEYAVEVDFEVLNGPSRSPSFRGGLVDVTRDVLGPPSPADGDYFPGAVSLDVDADGALDLFVWEGGRSRLLRQTAPLVFTEEAIDLPGRVECAGVADLDADGAPDVVAAGEGVWILRSVTGTLEPALSDGIPTWAESGQRFRGVTFADLDEDGLLDVAVAQMACGDGANVVLRNEGDFFFRDVAAELGVAHPEGATFAFAIDRPDPESGLLDIWSFEEGCTPVRTSLRRYRASDGLPELVHDVSPPLAYVSPMGSAWIDLDLDGALDLWVSGDIVSPVWAGPSFDREISVSTGLSGWGDEALRIVSAWSMVHLDADMDGYGDVFVVHDPSDPRSRAGTPADALFWRASPGIHRDVAAEAGLGGAHTCRAAHGADLDADGDLDLLVGCREGLRLLRNDLSDPGAGHTLVLRGTISNPNGVHARITTPSGEVRLVRGGGQPYAGGLESVAFATGREVTVRWPSGIARTVPIPAGTTALTVTEPDVVRVASRRVAVGAEVSIEVEPAALGTPDANVEARATAGTWSRPLAREADGVWRGAWLAPDVPAEAILDVWIDTLHIATRPRIFVR